jgi:hypothetical protein
MLLSLLLNEWVWVKAAAAQLWAMMRAWMVPGGVYRGCRWVAPAAMTQLLLQRTRGIWEVERVEMSDLSDNRGFIGVMRTCVVNDSLRLVLKMSSSDFESRRRLLLRNTYREPDFYSLMVVDQKEEDGEEVEFLPYLKDIIVSSWASPALGEYVIVMRDLTAAPYNGIGVNKIMGNQIFGVTESDAIRLDSLGLHDPLSTLQDVFDLAGRMHGRYANCKALMTEPQWSFLKGRDWRAGKGRDKYDRSVAYAKMCWDTNKDKGKYRVSDKIRQIIEASFALSHWENLQRFFAEEDVEFTLVHGDFHASNMMMLIPSTSGEEGKESTKKLFMYDWSEVGVSIGGGECDLAQMMISDVNPAITASRGRDLIHRYFLQLQSTAREKIATTEEQCYRRFCRGVDRWLWFYCVMMNMPQMPVPLMNYFHDQIEHFILHHGDYPAYLLGNVAVIE